MRKNLLIVSKSKNWHIETLISIHHLPYRA